MGPTPGAAAADRPRLRFQFDQNQAAAPIFSEWPPKEICASSAQRRHAAARLDCGYGE